MQTPALLVAVNSGSNNDCRNILHLRGILLCNREAVGNVPLTERQTSPSELGPENVDLSSFDGSNRMWQRLVYFLFVCLFSMQINFFHIVIMIIMLKKTG